MAGRWRLFRHDAGREAGPPPAAYILLFAACLLLGQWSASTFQAIIVWPANGVMLAALLQLRRRKATAVLLICFALNLASNLMRGDIMPLLLINAVLNMAQVLVAALLARRIGGAARTRPPAPGCGAVRPRPGRACAGPPPLRCAPGT